MRLGASIGGDRMIEDGSRANAPEPTPAPQVTTFPPTPAATQQTEFYSTPKPAPPDPGYTQQTTPLPTNQTSTATFNDSTPGYYANDERLAPGDINSGGIIQGPSYPWDTSAMQSYVDTVFTQSGKPDPSIYKPLVVTPPTPNPITGDGAATVQTPTGGTPLPTGGVTGQQTIVIAGKTFTFPPAVVGLAFVAALLVPAYLYGKRR